MKLTPSCDCFYDEGCTMQCWYSLALRLGSLALLCLGTGVFFGKYVL